MPPTAVFCTDDVAALGAVAAIYDSGRRLPEDIAIIGFGDQKVLPPHRFDVALSTVRQPLFVLGRDSFQILTRAIEQPEQPKVFKQYAAKLILRQSSVPSL